MVAQDVIPFDTLQQARTLRANGQLRKAEKLLAPWCADHPDDANGFWLRAQNEYWRKNFRKTSRYYRRAMSLDPQNLYLKLDFAEAQLGVGKFNQTRKWLLKLSTEEREDPHYQFVMAESQFWSGDVAAAQKMARSASTAGSEHALGLLKDIKLARSPWVALGGFYNSDSQPLESYEAVLEGGMFRSKWLDLRATATLQRFSMDSFSVQATRFELGNQFRFAKTGTVIGAAAGLFQLENQQAKPTAQLELTQRLPFGLKLHASAAQKPYLHTLTSLDTSIFFQQVAGEIEWSEPHGFWAKAGAQADVFEDKNQVTTYWGWAMTPALKIWRFRARAGYAYSFSDAVESRFASEKTLAQLLYPWDSTAQVKGKYEPYFTPEKMKTHAVLALLEYAMTKRISLTINGKYGFSASAQNPYLYLDLDENETVFIHREFQATNFTPIEIGAKLAVQFSEHWSAEANYAFNRNFFYEIQTAGAKLKCIF